MSRCSWRGARCAGPATVVEPVVDVVDCSQLHLAARLGPPRADGSGQVVATLANAGALPLRAPPLWEQHTLLLHWVNADTNESLAFPSVFQVHVDHGGIGDHSLVALAPGENVTQVVWTRPLEPPENATALRVTYWGTRQSTATVEHCHEDRSVDLAIS